MAVALSTAGSPKRIREKSLGVVRRELPRLSVVIVNYYQWANTSDLVDQIRSSNAMRNRSSEILIVDNHSPYHPIAQRLRRLPGVSLRRWGRNRGFACAVNEGCRLSQGNWLLLLNPDMTLPAGFIDQVIQLADELEEQDSRAGIIGFKLKNSDGSDQLSAGAFPTLSTTFTRLLLPRSIRKYSFVSNAHRSQVDWVTGCCLLLRRSCWEDLHGLDQDYFLYYEDVDLCLRAKQHSWTVWYEPTIHAIHHQPLHIRPVPALLRLVTRHSLLTYVRKHWPVWQFHCVAQMVREEARMRQWMARTRNDQFAAKVFGELRQLVSEMLQTRNDLVRKRIDRLTQVNGFYE